MTWRFKVQGVVFVVIILAVLALAAGASWIEGDVFDGFALF
jgi:hypothetical protein